MRRLLVFFLLLSLASFAQSAPEKPRTKEITIDAIVAPGGLTGRAPENVQWSPDSAQLSFVQRDDTGEHGELWSINPATGEKKVLVSEAKLSSLAPDVNKIKNEREKERITRYSVAAYHWSPDSKSLLFDSLGQLWLFRLESGTAVQFTSAPEPSDDPKFSPDGNHVAYVRKHNLYVRPVSGESDKQLTKDKDENLLNGEVDWVYAEELDVRSNYFWSPDSSQIVFLQMDESKVPSYPITDWLPLNPQVEQEKYPKPGDPNPAVRLGVINAKGGGVKWISLTEDRDIYIPRFGWIRDGLLWAQVLNRKQDTLDIYFVDAKSGHSRKVLTENSPDAWVNVSDDFRILKSGDRFLWASWRDGHTHLYLYSFDKQNPLNSEATLERQLTQGEFEVMGVKGIDADAGLVYFASNQSDPRQEQIFSGKLDGSGFQRISKEAGTHTASFSPNGKYFVDGYSASVTASRRSVCSAAGSPCFPIWESRSIGEYGFIAPKDVELKAEDGTPLYGQLVMPINPAADKVPLIVNVYGGPAAQMVKDAFGAGVTNPFNEMMAQHGYAVFAVDNRGTPNRGRRFLAALGHQFGAVELRDQLASLDQLLAQYPMLDRSRVCIWGWSNGGSMTLYSLLHSDAYRCGISGAPVTDWHDYDSIYTERYLGLPKENQRGYSESSMPAVANKLHGSLLLIHGTSDDNVHLQNSIQMINSLIQAGKQFRLMLYPGKTHGVTGKERAHLYQMMEDSLEQNLK
ncbi:MAG TPA: DPP IV N-terminal domain-containing protein [Terriglobales bacterium]|nr:DPP IV N-terminal domain-containing protein [Terriglobales bacterium]